MTLERKLTIEEAEAVFGSRNDEWERLKATMQPGDEIWTFCTSAESWRALAGRMGVALIRDGEAIGQIVTLMN